MIKWVANLTINDIEKYALSRFDVQNILQVSLKLTPQKFEVVPDQFEFYLKGITYNEDSKLISTVLEVGDELPYRRESINSFDSFAIEIMHGEIRLGYVPHEYAKIIAVEIDINATSYKINVLAFEDRDDWDDFLVTMERNQ